MTNRTLVLCGTLLLLAAPVLAQQPPARPPMPDHWLTLDSIATAVGLTADQRPAVTEHYAAINKLMKEAADERTKMRQAMGGGPPTPEQREQFMAMRRKFEDVQVKVDEHYAAIRNTLTEEQRVRLEQLPKPQVTMRRQGPSLQ